MEPDSRQLSRRRLLKAGLAAGAMAALSGPALAACSSGTTAGASSSAASSAGSSAGSTAGSTSAASAAGSTAASSAAGGQTVTFFGWDIADTTAGLGKGFQAVKEAWQQESGNSVTFDGVPFENFVAAGTTRARAKQLSDTLELLPDLNHAGIFPALKPVTKSDYPDLADQVTGWDAAIIDPASPESYAGVPGGAQGTLFYYNKKVFTDAGLDPEKPPETWAEFEAACTAIKGKGGTPLGMSGVDGNLLWWAWLSFSPQFFPTAADVLKVRTGEVKISDEPFLKSLQPIASTFGKGWWNADYASKKFADVESSFAAGEIGIVPGLITSAMNWKVWDTKLGKDAYGVFTPPLLDGGAKQGQFFNPVLLYAMSADVKDADTAKSWISFVISKKGQEIMLEQSGQFPNRSDIDVAAAAGSPGAAAIQAIVKKVGGVPVAQNQFNSAALSAATQNITSAAVSGDLQGFLNNLEQLQRA